MPFCACCSKFSNLLISAYLSSQDTQATFYGFDSNCCAMVCVGVLTRGAAVLMERAAIYWVDPLLLAHIIILHAPVGACPLVSKNYLSISLERQMIVMARTMWVILRIFDGSTDGTRCPQSRDQTWHATRRRTEFTSACV